VDPSDPQAIHQAVMQLISDSTLRADLIQAGFDNVARFRPEAVARRYEAVYAQVLSNQT
jgi:glycosyltransferase involved in cell wall biosynthesis